MGRFMPDEAVFRVVWEVLARNGRCDAPGGAEYKRVLSLWLAVGRPCPISRFLREMGPLAGDQFAAGESVTH